MSSIATANQGIAELFSGRVRRATTLLRQALVRFEDDPNGWLFTASLWLAQALALAGEPNAGRAELSRMRAARHPGFAFLDPAVLLTEARLHAAEGAISQAITLARESAQLCRDRGHFGLEVTSLQAATGFDDPSRAARLNELALVVQGPRATVAARHASVLSGADGAGLLAVSTAWEQLGDLIAAADSAAQASAAHAERGRRAAALTAAGRAQRLAYECEGLRTPALVEALSPLPLTAREREVVTLAAAGHTNREIAERLVVSIRTVEGHLYRATAKLGTAQRSGFASILQGQ